MATEPNTNTRVAPPNPTIRRYTCCCCLPVTSRSDVPSSITTWWRSVSHQGDNTMWWGRGVQVLMKLREWSELVAGPRWKTFIRRFNRNRSGGRLNGPFNYDPLSYALNFDEGPGQSGQFEVDATREFSARYAAVPKPGS